MIHKTQQTQYNLSFGQKLNKYAGKFFAEEAVQNVMPATVKKFLAQDVFIREDARAITVHAEAFKELKDAQTVEKIKQLFPDEPLFAMLTPSSKNPFTEKFENFLKSIKRTMGLQLAKETDKPEEKIDLAAFIVKKIFLEGKTLHEIQTDLDNTISTEGMRACFALGYQSLKKMGIKYPSKHYWKSIVNSREDYVKPGNSEYDKIKKRITDKSKQFRVNTGDKAADRERNLNMQLDTLLDEITRSLNEGGELNQYYKNQNKSKLTLSKKK